MEKAETPLQHVQANIAAACRIARREPEEVTLIAVSKMHPAEAIEPLLREGRSRSPGGPGRRDHAHP